MFIVKTFYNTCQLYYRVCKHCEIIDCDGKGNEYEFISATSEEDF